MTEEQAKKTRCCGGEGCGTKREVKRTEPPYNDTYVRFCIGSACMGWRVNDVADRIEQGISIFGGYCGIAGRP